MSTDIDDNYDDANNYNIKRIKHLCGNPSTELCNQRNELKLLLINTINEWIDTINDYLICTIFLFDKFKKLIVITY